MPTEPQIVNVLGEQVALNQINLPPAEKYLVSFEAKYKYEGMTGAEEQTVKNLFVQLFSASSPFLPGKTQPEPPCSAPEKQVLLKSLQHRFDSLRNELVGERKTGSNSLRLRQIVEHVQRLKNYIDFLQTTETCQEMDEDILGEALGDLTDEQILQLLRQFVFFVLQGRHPLKTFLGKDPNPKGFVARLSRNPITNFDAFLQDYKDQKYSIPIPIEKVLAVTQLGLDEMKEEVKNTMGEKTNAILQMIGDIIPEDDEFWNGLDKTNLESVIQRLLDTMSNLYLELDECNEKRNELEGALVEMSNEKDALEGEVQALQTKIAILEAEKASLPSSNDSNENSASEGSESRTSANSAYEALLAELQSDVDTYQARIKALELQEAELREQLEAVEEENAEKQAQIDALEGKEDEIKELQASNTRLTEELEAANAKIKACEELQARVNVLETQLAGSEDRLAELRGHAGELTRQIDVHLQEKATLVRQREKVEEELTALRGFAEKLQAFLNALEGDKRIVIDLLSNLQAARAELKPAEDSILQQIIALRNDLVTADAIPANMASMVGQILRQVQEEVNELDGEEKKLTALIEVQDGEIHAAQQAMEESNEVLRLVRAGRTELDGKGIQYETDKDFLADATRAVNAEKEVAAAKQELETAMEQLTAKHTSLLNDMAALQTKYEAELETVRAQVKTSEESLQQERATVATLQGTLATSESQKATLEGQVTALQADLQEATAAVERERADSAQRLQDLEEKKIRDCEEKLRVLREEEKAKRDTLLGAQGAEKGSLEARIAELLQQISTVESQRDGFEAAVQVEKSKFKEKSNELEAFKVTTQNRILELEARLKHLEQESSTAKGEAASLQSQLADATTTVMDLQGQIINDTAEKAKLYELISVIATWITSGAKLPKPTIDDTLNKKYGLDRILEAFLSSLPSEVSTQEKDSFSSAMSRCYLVFFMTYVYARHFPTKADGDSSNQSKITSFLRSILTNIYKQIDVGIPGKLDPVGSGGIPVQHKSKYLMNILLPLLKKMEVIHESGKKGADFLKFPFLEQDQVTTLRKLYTVAKDKINLAENKDILKTLNLYVIRRTGNVDDDIENLYLRFVKETATNREFPVILYVSPGSREIPKFTFPSEDQLSEFLSSKVEKSAPVKVAPPMDKALVSAPVFSFNLIFYLFLFTVKDYLSSVEGELSKAGCPLPPILGLH
jgi:DNA repair exonuclease SbcCD ATPase subunit